MHNNLATRNDIDLVLMGEDYLQIRFVFDEHLNFTVKGSDAFHLYNFLKKHRRTSGISTSENELLAFAQKHGLVEYPRPSTQHKKRREETSRIALPCFIPQRLSDDHHLIRVGNRVYAFKAKEEEEILHYISESGRSMVRKEDREVICELLTSPRNVEIDSALLHLNSTSANENVSTENRLEIMVLSSSTFMDSEPCDLRLHDPGLLLPKGFDFDSTWGKIVQWALSNRIVIEFSSELPETYSHAAPCMYAYRAAYQLPHLHKESLQFCFGSGATAEEALGKACMEAIERYYTQIPAHPDHIGTESNIISTRTPHVGVRELIHYLPEQIKILGITESDLQSADLPWCSGQDSEGKSILLPNAACHYGKYETELEQNYFRGNCSNGCAAHTNLEIAIKSAIYENIERDAVLVWWYNRLSPPRISTNLLPNDIKSFIEKNKDKTEILVLDLTLDTLPVVMIVGRSATKSWPYFLCGAACSSNVETAIKKAFQEFYLAYSNWENSLPVPCPELREVKTPLDHELIYLTPSNSEVIDFFFNGDEHYRLPEAITTNLPPYFVYKSHSTEIDKSFYIHVVKVVMPSLVPMTFGYMCDPLDHPRIYELPVRLGLRNKPVLRTDLLAEYIPHFFP